MALPTRRCLTSDRLSLRAALSQLRTRAALTVCQRCPARDRIVGEEIMATANPVGAHQSGDATPSSTTPAALPCIGADESGKGEDFGPSSRSCPGAPQRAEH